MVATWMALSLVETGIIPGNIPTFLALEKCRAQSNWTTDKSFLREGKVFAN